MSILIALLLLVLIIAAVIGLGIKYPGPVLVICLFAALFLTGAAQGAPI